MLSQTTKSSGRQDSLFQRYSRCRQQTVDLCEPLETEDYVVQPHAEISPPKWHLAHSSWFFEELVLKRHYKNYKAYNEKYGQLFNSYYKGLGPHAKQGQRGTYSRPTVAEVLDYRRKVDEGVRGWFESNELSQEAKFIVEVGINHEEQHQELLLMDIKSIFATNSPSPNYSKAPLPKSTPVRMEWVPFTEGLFDFGFSGGAFFFDNEGPRHQHYLYPFAMSSTLVSNRDFLEFVDSGAYRNPTFWLSMGWDWVELTGAGAPLYWSKQGNQWFEFTLHGTRELDLDSPVAHINYFEAEAFARWKGCRLPTEFEFERFLQSQSPRESGTAEYFHATDVQSPRGALWCWTQSPYLPYPGFERFRGSIEEYNGKFMCNQFVLRGGSVATPRGHYRDTYRNFFLPQQQWMFSGIRLAKDIK